MNTATTTQFDPWDWLGVHCGGYFKCLDRYVMRILKETRDIGRPNIITNGDTLVCTLLCNTDAFEFDGDPTQLRWVGDERFKTLGELIEAWEGWYRERYG